MTADNRQIALQYALGGDSAPLTVEQAEVATAAADVIYRWLDGG
jgi:hypothetical protein